MSRGAIQYARIPQEEPSENAENDNEELNDRSESAANGRFSSRRHHTFVSDLILFAKSRRLKYGFLLLVLFSCLVVLLYTTLGKRVSSKALSPDVEDNTIKTITSDENNESLLNDDEDNEDEGHVSLQNSTESLVNLCPNWTPEFAKRYEQECAIWLEEIRSWEMEAIKSKKTVAYSCPDPSACRGWGDRLGGIQSALHKAIADKTRFRIAHPNLQRWFSPCLLQSRATNWAYSKADYNVPVSSCKVTPASSCYSWFDLTCSSVMATEYTNRACMKEGVCKKLQDHFTGEFLDPVRVFGCGLRAIMEPSEALLTRVKVPLKMGHEHSKMMNLRQISELFKQYYVIGIHFRMGDAYAFFNKAGDFTLNEERYVRPFRCAKTLESYLSETPGVIEGKPVKWFVSSDSLRLKWLANSAFGDRVIYISLKPQHVAIRTGVDDLAHTLVEWYVIGLADQLIVNRIGTEHGNFYHGRVSAFPKTSWVTHLKHLAYDAGTCEQYSLPLEGIWSDAKQKICGRHSLAAQGRQHLPQDHLRPLNERNLTFPFYYIDAGEILAGKVDREAEMKFSSLRKKNDDNDDDDDNA